MAAARNVFVAALAVLPSLGSAEVCPAGSLVFMDCEFPGDSKCWPGINVGQRANPGWSGPCEVPSPQNDCALKFDRDQQSWMWQSQSGTECCNCFQQKSVCPSGTKAHFDCHSFQTGGDCFGGVNFGEAAMTANTRACEAPSERNGCMIDFDQNVGAWMWSSNQGVQCCNCFQERNAYTQSSLLAQAKAHKHLRRGVGHGDEASMLQVPLEEDVPQDETDMAEGPQEL